MLGIRGSEAGNYLPEVRQRGRKKLDRCAGGRETSWIPNGLSAGPGSRELEAGSQNPEAMRRASGEGSLPGVSAVPGLKRGGGGGIGWLAGGRALYQSPKSTKSAGTLDQGPPFTGPSFACWDRPPLTLESGYRVLLVSTWHRDSIGCTYLTI